MTGSAAPAAPEAIMVSNMIGVGILTLLIAAGLLLPVAAGGEAAEGSGN